MRAKIIRLARFAVGEHCRDRLQTGSIAGYAKANLTARGNNLDAQILWTHKYFGRTGQIALAMRVASVWPI
jgi:hypothetical protein